MRRSKHSDDSRLFFDWLEIAARDLLAARLLMERQQCLEIAGFHCQQAVEKGLKAYIIHASGQRYHAAAQSLYDFICELVYENGDIEDD